MKKYALGFLALSCVVAACGQHSENIPPGAGEAVAKVAQIRGPLAMTVVGPNTIGIELPAEGLGTVQDAKFGLVGGFTETTRSQIIAFKPGTTITIRNLSNAIPHTLNVLSTTGFPAHPTLLTTPSGGPMQKGYRTGVLEPGKSVKVALRVAGTYFVGCAFHYPEIPSMRDVVKVKLHATPGPQAT